MQQPILIAIDGPAGAGKSTLAKALAQTLGFSLVDTGAIYRTVALVAQRRGCAWDHDQGLAEIVQNLPIRFKFADGLNRVWLGDEDVTELIRTQEISMGASLVSARGVVRSGLLELQRRLAGYGDSVLEGRDIGTVVCPHAQIKIFLDATPEERARRRTRELAAKNQVTDFQKVLDEIKQRDQQDTTRALAPLKPAADAQIVDSTTKSAEDVLRLVAKRVQELKDRQ